MKQKMFYWLSYILGVNSNWSRTHATAVENVPTEDVAPVVHAEWKVNEHIELDFCSNCLEPVRRYVTAGQMDRSNYKGETFWNYCPHCGAKMDGVIYNE